MGGFGSLLLTTSSSRGSAMRIAVSLNLRKSDPVGQKHVQEH